MHLIEQWCFYVDLFAFKSAFSVIRKILIYIYAVFYDDNKKIILCLIVKIKLLYQKRLLAMHCQFSNDVFFH